MLPQRHAAHYILHKEQLYKMHYAEFAADGSLRGIYPFEQEIAGTTFRDGLIVLESAAKFSTHDGRSNAHIERFGRFSAIWVIRYVEPLAD